MNNIKKTCLSLAALVMAMSASLYAWHEHQTSINGGLLSENVEALTQTESSYGRWVVTVYTPSHWECKPNGGVCCPGVDC